jgi:hypothetical protein
MRTVTAQDGQYITSVLNKLQDNPTDSDIDFLIEAHARIGYLSAMAQGIADELEAKRKYTEAEVVNQVKLDDPKAPASVLEARATLGAWSARQEEVKARTQARKIYNLHSSVEQAINAIKYLGRNAGVSLPNGR